MFKSASIMEEKVHSIYPRCSTLFSVKKVYNPEKLHHAVPPHCPELFYYYLKHTFIASPIRIVYQLIILHVLTAV